MHRQIVEQVTAKVAAGDWSPSAELPPVREMAAANGVSVITVKRAYLELEHAGVIATRHGKGLFVVDSTEPARACLLAELIRHIDAMLLASQRLGLAEHDLQDLIAGRCALSCGLGPSK
jgi:GntR family transcriptional regulator